MRVYLESDIWDVTREMKSLADRQVKFAARLALNDAAFRAKKDLGPYAEKVFDGPVAATKKAGLVEKAKTWGQWPMITAKVYIKKEMSGGVPPRRYLQAQAFGGGRDDKTSEKRFHDTIIRTKKWGAQQVLPRGWQTIVHKDYQNSKGNITKGMIQKIMADLRAFHDPRQNRADDVKGRFFVIHPDWNIKGMTPGIYERKGKRMKIVLIFKPRSRISYTPRYDLYEAVRNSVLKHFPTFFKRRYSQAVATRKAPKAVKVRGLPAVENF